MTHMHGNKYLRGSSALVDIDHWDRGSLTWVPMTTCRHIYADDRIQQAIREARKTGNYDIDASDFRTLFVKPQSGWQPK